MENCNLLISSHLVLTTSISIGLLNTSIILFKTFIIPSELGSQLAFNIFEVVINIPYYKDMNIPKFIIGILLVIPGAFMIADGVLAMLGDNVIFFEGVNTKFEFVIGYALIILGASNLDSKHGK